MTRCKKMLSMCALTLPFALLFGLSSGADASEETQELKAGNLCIATGIRMPHVVGDEGGCVYSGPDVPVFDDYVCWDGSTPRLRGAGGCPADQKTYYVQHGELLDPTTGEIEAYAALPNACDIVPCGSTEDNNLPEDDDVACCDPDTGDCWMSDDGDCTVGDITWCEDITDNGDGTVTCH